MQRSHRTINLDGISPETLALLAKLCALKGRNDTDFAILARRLKEACDATVPCTYCKKHLAAPRPHPKDALCWQCQSGIDDAEAASLARQEGRYDYIGTDLSPSWEEYNE